MKYADGLGAIVLEMLGLDGRVYMQAVAESKALDNFDSRSGLSLIIAGIYVFIFTLPKAKDKTKALMTSFWLALPMMLAGFWTNWFIGEFLFDLRRAGFALALSAGLFLMFFKNRAEGTKENAPSVAQLLFAGSTLLAWPVLGLATAWLPVFIILTLSYKSIKGQDIFFSALAPFLILKGSFLLLTAHTRGTLPDFDTQATLSYAAFPLLGIGTFNFIRNSFEKKKLMILAYILLAAGLVVLFKTSRGGFSPIQIQQAKAEVMGTEATVTIWDREKISQEAASEVFRIFNEINDTLSTYKEDSEISRLNREAFGKKFKCSKYLWENLIAARQAYQFSNGGFDVTIRPLIKLWNFTKKRDRLPSDEEIAIALSQIGFNKIEFFDDEQAVRFKQEGLEIDLGGIAKGYAVDLAVARLKEMGISRAIINLGGNMYCFGKAPKGETAYRIAVKDPSNKNTSLMTLPLLAQAISTSGNYERFVMINGKRYPHIVDPRTGWPVDKVDSVTVISPSALWADILSTAIFVEGEDFIDKVQKAQPKSSVLFIDIQEDGSSKIIKKGQLFQ